MAPSPKSEKALVLSLDQARRAAVAAQGLDRPGTDPVETLSRTGFVRTLGGVDVYVAARARVADLDRPTLDDAVAARELQVLPTVRGCIYLVARPHAAASLRLADLLSRRRMERDHTKVGLGEDELEAVVEAVVEALGDGPATPHALRRRLPEGTVRGLGDVGKKIGLSSTLPSALRRAEFAGRIERRLPDGRLDSERYLWARTDGDPFAELDPDPAAVHRHMAEVYLRTAAFGTPEGFADWSGLGRRDARAAVAALDTVPVEIEDVDGPFLALAENAETLQAAPEAPPAFLPFEDNLVALRQGPAFFVDPEHHGIPVPVWGRSKGSTLGDVRHASVRPVVAESRLVGFWELDPDAEEVVTGLFAPVAAATRKNIAEEAASLGRFLVDELGHGRSFSIDTDDHLRKRCAYIRTLEA